MTKLYLAEDQEMLATALVGILDLEDDFEIVGSARDGKTALNEILLRSPDVAILDIEMPQMTGLAVAKELRSRKLNIKIIILTTFAQEAYFQQAVAAEVDGYLLKDASSDSLIRAIHNILEGDRVFAPELVTRSFLAEKCPLTERELEVLKVLQKGGSAAEISQTVYLSEGTVRNYISSILSKTGTHSRIEAINLAKENKWL